MGKGKPFLELFVSALHEDYRFPILEVFAFLYALGTFALALSLGSLWYSASEEVVTYTLTSLMMGLPLFVFVVLVFKNIAYGFGSDLEKGTIQTLLSYPLKRHAILTAKLLSAIGLSLIVFLGIQVSALFLLAPDLIASNLHVVALTYAAGLSYPLLLSGIILLTTMGLKRGGLAIVVGIVLYFVLNIARSILTFVAIATESAATLQVLSIIDPSLVLQIHYGGGFMVISGGRLLWSPSFSEAVLYTCGSYVFLVFVFALAYYYFARRLGF